jgi:uncharacterized RDD family membrane protein YckC
MDWFYAESGRQVGPIDETSFQALVTAGLVRDDTLVWRAGMANWLPYQSVRPSAVPPAIDGDTGASMRFCSECGKSFPPDQLVAFGSSLVCAACKPLYAQKLLEGVQPHGAIRYGGFWLRFVALIVDSVVLSMVSGIVSLLVLFLYPVDFAAITRSRPDILQMLALEGRLVLVNLVLAGAYDIWMVGRFGATLGKLALQLRIVRGDGGKVSYGRALGRHCAKYLSSFTLCIGYIMAGIDEEKRSLHDRICDTRVIKK